MSATLSTIGLYNYDPTLFDELVLPEGLEKDLAVNTILMRSGEMEVLYPDPEFYKSQIGYWGRKHYRTFQKWVEALSIEYDPLYNYDRTEETVDEDHSTNHSKTEADYDEDRTLNTEDKRTINTQDKRTADLKDATTYNTTDTDSQSVSETTERQVAAFNSSNYENKEKDTHNIGTVSHTKTGDQHTDTTGTDTMDHSGTDTIDKTGTDKLNTKGTLSDTAGGEDRTFTHRSRVFGNIGVTTSMQLLREELEVQRFSLYDQIADLFVEEFCIMIY